MIIMENCLYTKEHEWVRVDLDTVLIGITDYAQHAMGEIVYVELPEDDAAYEQGEAFGVVESVKAASDIYMPLSGTVVKVNTELEDDPGLINSDPYQNWIVGVKLNDSKQLDGLMNAVEYEQFCNSSCKQLFLAHPP